VQSQQILQQLKRIIDDLPEDFYGCVEIEIRAGVSDFVRVNRTIKLQSNNNGGANGTLRGGERDKANNK
jgi:hypothetical protein